MEKMTIHRGLAELKLIDARITKQTNEIIPTGINQKGKNVNGIYSETDFTTNAKGKYDSVLSLIDRKMSIKSAIIQANGETQVTIGDKSMTIAEAINYKAIIKFKKELVNKLKAAHKQTVGELNKLNEKVETNVQAILEATFGKENVKVGDKDVENVRTPYMEANTFHLFDPLKVEETVSKMEKDISEFEAEVDAVLSEINATTFITF